MKKTFIFVWVFLLKLIISSAQVGIGTESPQAMLDIVGDLRIGTVETVSGTADSVLVLNEQHIVSKAAISDIMQSNLISYVKGTGGGTIVLDADILTGWKIIAFSNTEFDTNGDYDNVTFQFTAPKDGINQIYAQYRTSSLLSAGNLGIGIFRQTGEETPVLIAEESYLQVGVNLGLITIEVSPPVRKTQTLAALTAGDKIFFGSRVPIANLTLLGGPESFFTIHQVH